MAPKKKTTTAFSDDEEDDTFYYRYPSTTTTTSAATGPKPSSTSAPRASATSLAPSKSTLYVSNLDYALTNSDLHTLFSHFGKIARVTVLKDRETRQSRGVAFIQYVTRQDAQTAAREMQGKVLNGRKLKAAIAVDNGRAAEFIRKRVYRDKSRCYECGVEGHLSYECPKNQLGKRERPVSKKGRRGGGGGGGWRGGEEEGEEGGGEEGFEEENWASVVDGKAEERLIKGGSEEVAERKKAKKASYFSDESDEDE